MKKFKTSLTRILIFNKRLLKKPSFILILCLIPLFVLSLVFFTKEESGILTITLCAEDNNDPLANEIISSLMSNDGVLIFVKSKSIDEAYESVKLGKSDAAWIFEEDLQSKIDKFVDSNMRKPFVKVVERETDIFLQLSHETLTGCIYPYISYSLFNDFLYTEMFTVEQMPESEIKEGYNNAVGGGNIVELEKLDSSSNADSTTYLTAPMRGILSLIIVLCGLASIMYYQTDRENGTYDWLPTRKHILFGLATTGSAVFDCAVIAVISLMFSGLYTIWYVELASALLFVTATTAFCTVIGCITRKASATAHIIPFVMMILLVISPIFFNLKSLSAIQSLIPTYYYLYAVYDPIYLLYMAIYSAVLFFFAFILNKIIER